MYVGIINKRKNLSLLLKTLGALRKKDIRFDLEVIGGFENTLYENEIHNIIEKEELAHQVHFRGWQSQLEVIAAIQSTDLLVMTSFAETLPMVIAETMSAGRAVISSAVGGIPTQIENEKDGWLFDLQQPERLTSLMESIYKNPDLVLKCATAAREKALQLYESNAVAHKTLAFYQTVLNQQTSNPQ